MIRFMTGNLLKAPAEALVNTVNEVGVMGKGIALMFRDAFPANTEAYERAVKSGGVRVGRMFVTENRALVGPKWIINFPTKRHWRNPSKLEWVRDGLTDLVEVIRLNGIRSVAVPPLGCGNGGLDWVVVKREIEGALAVLDDVEVLVYEPTGTYQNAPKRSGLEALTPARALVAEMVRRYSVLGLECTNLEVQKLAWFLHRSITALRLSDPLRLEFSANKYGPYADRLRHLLDGLDGSYLHCEKRLSDAGPFDLIWFEDSKREAVTAYLSGDSGAAYRPAVERASDVIDGFESPLGMEALATVDWLLSEGATEATVPAVRQALRAWPGGKSAADRKLRLFDDRLIDLALQRLAPASVQAGQNRPT
jgi:O-acetyl-ADP-ribose deacetylase (regulator of RNase III)